MRFLVLCKLQCLPCPSSSWLGLPLRRSLLQPHNNTKFVIEPEQVFEIHAFMSVSAATM